MPKLFGEGERSLNVYFSKNYIERWKEQQGAKRPYKGQYKQPTATPGKIPVMGPESGVGMEQVGRMPTSYEEYTAMVKQLAPVIRETQTPEQMLSRSELDSFIKENVPAQQKQFIPFGWWQQFGTPEEIETAIGTINTGLLTGDRAKWTQGLTETAFAAKRGLISPDEVYYAGMSELPSEEEAYKSVLDIQSKELAIQKDILEIEGLLEREDELGIDTINKISLTVQRIQDMKQEARETGREMSAVDEMMISQLTGLVAGILQPMGVTEPAIANLLPDMVARAWENCARTGNYVNIDEALIGLKATADSMGLPYTEDDIRDEIEKFGWESKSRAPGVNLYKKEQTPPAPTDYPGINLYNR